MKIRLFCLGMMLFLLASCAGEKPLRLPKFVPESPHFLNSDQKKSCALVFPEGNWQFVHSIEFTLASGEGSTVVGVTVLDGNAINCALMTIEGLTLFAARYTDRLEIFRAVPPFDKPAFATGLMDDVRAIFVRPTGRDVQYGHLRENAVCCRITAENGSVTDVIPSDNDCWRINTYSSELIKTRTIIARSCNTIDLSIIPGKLELTVPGPTGYTLRMNLMSAENMETATTNNPKNVTQ